MGKKNEESHEILDRVQRDSETFGSSSLRRMTDHFTGRDAIGQAEGGATDPIELWGRRIGRTLSVIGVIVLTYWLAVQLKLV